MTEDSIESKIEEHIEENKKAYRKMGIVDQGVSDGMSLDEYQKRTRETAVYPAQEAIEYLGLGLNDEAGEVAGAIKKHMRGDYDADELRERIRGEAGDVLWYWVRLLDEMDLDASEVMEANADKVFDRKERGVIRGDGDNR